MHVAVGFATATEAVMKRLYKDHLKSKCQRSEALKASAKEVVCGAVIMRVRGERCL
jgi:hypothetical protein